MSDLSHAQKARQDARDNGGKYAEMAAATNVGMSSSLVVPPTPDEELAMGYLAEEYGCGDDEDWEFQFSADQSDWSDDAQQISRVAEAIEVTESKDLITVSGYVPANGYAWEGLVITSRADADGKRSARIVDDLSDLFDTSLVGRERALAIAGAVRRLGDELAPVDDDDVDALLEQARRMEVRVTKAMTRDMLSFLDDSCPSSERLHMAFDGDWYVESVDGDDIPDDIEDGMYMWSLRFNPDMVDDSVVICSSRRAGTCTIDVAALREWAQSR